MRDGLDQVGLAESHAPPDKEGVVGQGRRLRHRQGRRVGELVAVAHNEVLKGVPGVQIDLSKGGNRDVLLGSGGAVPGRGRHKRKVALDAGDLLDLKADEDLVLVLHVPNTIGVPWKENRQNTILKIHRFEGRKPRIEGYV